MPTKVTLSIYVLIGLICYRKIFACFSQQVGTRVSKSEGIDDIIGMLGKILVLVMVTY